MSECYYYDSPVTRMNIEFKYHFLPKTMLFVHTNIHGIHQNTESKPVVGGSVEICCTLSFLHGGTQRAPRSSFNHFLSNLISMAWFHKSNFYDSF